MTDFKDGGVAPDRAQALARGQALRSARVARARSIRRRIIAGSLALFVAAWLLITLVLVSGHDPALAKKLSGSSASSATTVASTPATTTASGSDTSTTGSTQSSDTSSSSGSSSGTSSATSSSGTSSGTSSSGGVSSVTTSQS